MTVNCILEHYTATSYISLSKYNFTTTAALVCAHLTLDLNHLIQEILYDKNVCIIYYHKYLITIINYIQYLVDYFTITNVT